MPIPLQVVLLCGRVMCGSCRQLIHVAQAHNLLLTTYSSVHPGSRHATLPDWPYREPHNMSQLHVQLPPRSAACVLPAQQASQEQHRTCSSFAWLTCVLDPLVQSLNVLQVALSTPWASHRQTRTAPSS